MSTPTMQVVEKTPSWLPHIDVFITIRLLSLLIPIIEKVPVTAVTMFVKSITSSKFEVLLVFGIGSGLNFLGGLTYGWIGDKIKIHNAIKIAAGTTTLGCLVFPFIMYSDVTHVAALIVAGWLSFHIAGLFVLRNPLVAVYICEEDVIQVVTQLEGIYRIGGVIGTLLSLMCMYLDDTPRHTLPHVITVIFAMLCFIVTLTFEAPKDKKYLHSPHLSQTNEFYDIATKYHFVACVATLFWILYTISLPPGLVMDLWVLDATSVMLFDVARIAANAVSSVMLIFGCRYLLQRFQNEDLFATFAFACTMFIFIIATVPSVDVANVISLYVVYKLLNDIVRVFYTGIYVLVLKDEEEGRWFGIINIIHPISSFVSIGVGALVDAHGTSVAFLIVGSINLLVTVGYGLPLAYYLKTQRHNKMHPKTLTSLKTVIG